MRLFEAGPEITCGFEHFGDGDTGAAEPPPGEAAAEALARLSDACVLGVCISAEGDYRLGAVIEGVFVLQCPVGRRRAAHIPVLFMPPWRSGWLAGCESGAPRADIDFGTTRAPEMLPACSATERGLPWKPPRRAYLSPLALASLHIAMTSNSRKITNTRRGSRDPHLSFSTRRALKFRVPQRKRRSLKKKNLSRRRQRRQINLESCVMYSCCFVDDK